MIALSGFLDSWGMVLILFGVIGLFALYVALLSLIGRTEAERLKWVVWAEEGLLAVLGAFHLTHHSVLLGGLELFCLFLFAIRMQWRIGTHLRMLPLQKKKAETEIVSGHELLFWSPLLLFFLYVWSTV